MPKDRENTKESTNLLQFAVTIPVTGGGDGTTHGRLPNRLLNDGSVGDQAHPSTDPWFTTRSVAAPKMTLMESTKLMVPAA